MNKVLIVGYGVVGRNLSVEIGKLNPDIYDKYKQDVNTKRNLRYDVAFICVDTPYSPKSNCDRTEVLNAINENDADIYVIKSTVLPSTTESLREMTGKRIIFSPEYYGGTQHCNNFNFDFTILGGEKEDCRKVVQMLQDVYDARHQFRIVDSKTAELTKYMENSWLATKVTFCISFYEMCKKLGISYEEVRELFVLDPRVNPAHTFVYEEHPYYKSHCLDKDVPAIAEYMDDELLKTVIKMNDKRKQ